MSAGGRGSLAEHLAEAQHKAIDSLARYKFMQFGYWASIWVHLNRMSEKPSRSPFTPLVALAREIRDATGAEVPR